MALKEEDRQKLCMAVDQESFAYCFVGYSDWEQVDDPKFHELRKAFVEAATKLEDYLDIDNWDYDQYDKIMG